MASSLQSMATSLLRVRVALILVINGVASASAMVMPCHGTQALEGRNDLHSHHAGHGLHQSNSHLRAAIPLPCDGACCDGLACPGHAAALIVPQAAVLRIAVSGPTLMDQRLMTTDPVLRPLVPPYRPPAY